MDHFDENCKHMSGYNLLPATTILIQQDIVSVLMKQLHALWPPPLSTTTTTTTITTTTYSCKIFVNTRLAVQSTTQQLHVDGQVTKYKVPTSPLFQMMD